VLLHRLCAIQPSPRVLALMYKMTDYKDGYYQSVAFQALARVRPLPSRAKELFRTRLVRQPGKDFGTRDAVYPSLSSRRPGCSANLRGLCRRSRSRGATNCDSYFVANGSHAAGYSGSFS
jgi:hypothetical protein